MNEVVSDFLKFEKEENLFARTYLNVPYWQSIRFTIMHSLTVEQYYTAATENRNFVLEMFKNFFEALRDCIDFIRMTQCDILYFDECVYRRINNELVDTYFDYFNFEECYKVERCFHNYYSRSLGKKKGVGVAIPNLKSRIENVLGNCQIFNNCDKKEEIFIDAVIDKINKLFRTAIDSEIIKRSIRMKAISQKYFEKYYYKLLKRCRPKVIFVVCYFDFRLLPLYGVAKSLGIPVIEIQHGQIAYHPAYCYEDLSDVGKELPSNFFIYGGFWKQVISLPNNVKVNTVGNPFLESRVKRYQNLKQDDKKIVVYSCYGIPNIIDQLTMDIRNYFGKKGYKILFKIHPVEQDSWEKNYPMVASTEDIHIIPINTDLYEVLQSSRHHISSSSTVLYEAIIFDNKRYVYDLGGLSDFVQPLVDMNMALKFKTMQELEVALHTPHNNSSSFVSNVWKINAKQNAHKIVESMIRDEKETKKNKQK